MIYSVAVLTGFVTTMLVHAKDPEQGNLFSFFGLWFFSSACVHIVLTIIFG